MAYFGRHQLGEEIRLQVVCRNGSQDVVMPDAAPTLDIWQATTLIAQNLLMFPTDRLNVPGLFIRPFRLANFASGLYNCVFRWKKGSFHGVALGAFEIVDGGNRDGSCISMIYFQAPSGQFLVRQTDAGILKQGKNPQ